MLFSGVAQSYRCADCKVNYSTVIPTSIIPITISLLLIAAPLWILFFETIIGDHWIIVPLGIAFAIASLPVGILLPQRIFAPWTGTLMCPQCAEKLTVIGGGFFNGIPPGKEELFMYLFVMGVPLVLLHAATYYLNTGAL